MIVNVLLTNGFAIRVSTTKTLGRSFEQPQVAIRAVEAAIDSRTPLRGQDGSYTVIPSLDRVVAYEVAGEL